MTESNTDPNLLVDLHNFAKGRDEDFTTKVFAYVLRYLLTHKQTQKAGRDLLRTLTGDRNLKTPERVKISTHEKIEGGDRPDIQISGDNFRVIVEVKVSSRPDEDQLGKYRKTLNKIKVRNKYLVLLTKTPPDAEKVRGRYYPVRWEEVAEKLTQLKGTVKETTIGGYLIRQLLEFFKAQMLSREHTSRQTKKNFDVWRVSITKGSFDDLDKIGKKTKVSWTAPRTALKGDLILFYRGGPDSIIQDIFVLADLPKYDRSGWKGEPAWMAPYHRVAKLKHPIRRNEDLKYSMNKSLREVVNYLQGVPNKISKYWPDLYEFILKQNPGINKEFKKYEPE